MSGKTGLKALKELIEVFEDTTKGIDDVLARVSLRDSIIAKMKDNPALQHTPKSFITKLVDLIFLSDHL